MYILGVIYGQLQGLGAWDYARLIRNEKIKNLKKHFAEVRFLHIKAKR